MSDTKSCPYCGLAQADQHSLRESGICDGIKRGKIDPAIGKAAIKQRESVKRVMERVRAS